MSRMVEEIKADIAQHIENGPEIVAYCLKDCSQCDEEMRAWCGMLLLENELKNALYDACMDGRCVVLPYNREERCYVVDDDVKRGYRTTRLNYYQVYADNTKPHVIAKTTAVEHWYELDEIFPTLEAVKDGVKKMHQKKRESCLKYGHVCSECRNDYCKAREEAEAALSKA